MAAADGILLSVDSSTGGEMPHNSERNSTLSRRIGVVLDVEHVFHDHGVHPSIGALPPWWTAETVAVVTGANKGIGYAIVRKLALEGITVVLATHDEGRGLKATDDLHSENLKNVVFHKLDIADPDSVTEFANWLKQTYDGLDILVNNAGVHSSGHTYDTAVYCLSINYFGTINLTEKLLPMFKKSAAGARVINISSIASFLANVNDENLRKRLSETSNFDQEFVNNVAKKYEAACQASTDEVHLYGISSYVVSKILLNAYTRLLAARVADLPEGSKIYVNCVQPGIVDTDMLHEYRETITPAVWEEVLASGKLGKDGLVTTETAADTPADTPAWLALLPPGGPSGLFWNKRTVLSYYYWS